LNIQVAQLLIRQGKIENLKETNQQMTFVLLDATKIEGLVFLYIFLMILLGIK